MNSYTDEKAIESYLTTKFCIDVEHVDIPFIDRLEIIL